MSNVPRPPSEILQAIDRRACDVRTGAALLTKCIEEFENYLSNLNGRVEAYTWGDHPDSSPGCPTELGLGLERRGKTWIITFGSLCPGQNPDDSEWTPLKEASLKVKIAGVRMFPDLLEAIEKSQISLVQEIEKAVQGFHSFASTLKSKDAAEQRLPLPQNNSDSGEKLLPPLVPSGFGKTNPTMPPLSPSSRAKSNSLLPPLDPSGLGKTALGTRNGGAK
jgi:hypothetical protein